MLMTRVITLALYNTTIDNIMVTEHNKTWVIKHCNDLVSIYDGTI